MERPGAVSDRLEGYPNLGREDPVSGLVADVAEGFTAIQAKLRIRDLISALVIAERRPVRRCRMVEYVVSIEADIDALAFHEFDVLAHGQVYIPSSHTG